MLGRVEKRSSNKDRVDVKKPTQVRIVSATAAATTLTVNFDQPVVLKGTPNWTLDVAGEPVSATSPSLNQVVITYSRDISAAAAVNIPVANPAIRNKVGGFVADTTFAV